jgi:hypothetical protein
MEVDLNSSAILDALTHYDRLPADAIRAADADRAAMLPVFLEAIERYIAQTPEERKKPNPLFFIFNILGSWREKAAYRPLSRLLLCERDNCSAVGESAVETTHRVMAAVFDGDPEPLYRIILDPHVDEFIRSRMCQALAMVVLRGELARSEAIRFLVECFDKLEPKVDCFVWYGWHEAIAMLGLKELRPLVGQAFERESIGRQITELKYFDADLAKSLEYPDGSPWLSDGEFTLLGDTVEEFSTWYGFSEEYYRSRERAEEDWDDEDVEPGQRFKEFVPGTPVINPLRHIGRNDPCPCGSGKKYKKCCLA